MKKHVICLGIILLSAIAMISCSKDNDIAQEDAKESPDGNETQIVRPEEKTGKDDMKECYIPLSDNQKTAVAKNNDFAFRFFRKVSELSYVKGTSFVCSPLSATYTLGILNSGSQGVTSEEITSMLGFGGGSKQDVNDLCKQLIDNAPIVDESVALKLADCVILHLGIELSEAYKKDIQDYYDSEIFSKDFTQASTIDFINDWCSKHTEGMIKKIIGEGELSAEAKMVVMNAVYFNAPWSGMFKPQDTNDEEFTCEDGSKQHLQVMRRQDATYYSANEQYEVIGLPYGNGKNWIMYVLLPKEGKNVDDVLKGLNNDSWNRYRPFGSEAIMVDVKLPKFRIESDLFLNSIFNDLGATAMFNEKLADFRLITSDAIPLWINQIKQKAVIDVSEEGTEASAVTIAMVASSGLDSSPDVPEVKKFYATHPFVYLIQETSSDAIFFIGTYQGN